MTVRALVTTLPLIGVSLLFTSGVHAAFSSGTYCSAPGDHPDGLSISDVTLNDGDATDCYGLVDIGGNVTDEIGSINQLGWGTFTTDKYLKDDGGVATATFLGMDWELSADNTTNDGTYTLTVTDNDLTSPPDLPFETDIVAFLKAGTPGAFYLFKDVLIDTSNAGTFEISWTNGGGQFPALSGMSLFVGDARPPGGGPGIPEPGTLVLLGGPLLGLTFLRRRYNRD